MAAVHRAGAAAGSSLLLGEMLPPFLLTCVLLAAEGGDIFPSSCNPLFTALALRAAVTSLPYLLPEPGALPAPSATGRVHGGGHGMGCEVPPSPYIAARAHIPLAHPLLHCSFFMAALVNTVQRCVDESLEPAWLQQEKKSIFLSIFPSQTTQG